MTFRLTILGSSGALPVYGRFTSAQLLVVHHHHFLIDCGEGCQHQLRRYDFSPHKISHIFISHLHGDHYLGLMGLIFSMQLLQREHDLHVYAFSGLEEIIVAQLRHAQSSLRFKVVLHPLGDSAPEILFEDDHVVVQSFPLDHKIPTCGFLFREKQGSRSLRKESLADLPVQYRSRLKKGEDILDPSGQVLFRSEDFTLPPKQPRSYAYCSDTQPSKKVIPVIRDVALLYHEATFLENEKEKARETRHSTAAEAALVAQESGAGKLLIGHFSARYKDLQPVLEEAKRIFPATALATEGETFDIVAS